MKKVTALFLFAALLVSAASAEILCTAYPLGQGKWAFEATALRDTNVSNTSDRTSTGYGISAMYGINNQLDFVIGAGTATYGGTLTAGVTGMSVISYAAVCRYSLIKESESMPVSLATGFGYRTLALTSKTALGDVKTNGGKSAIGLIVSKFMIPFIPYGALSYTSTSLGGNSTSLDLTVGSGFTWSEQGQVYLEYTLQSISASGANYSTPQIGFGVGYAL